jgi:hypothetical protein
LGGVVSAHNKELKLARNPFHHLYVGEHISPDGFVALFSHYLVPHAMALFERGNVVLTGIQGSGKSMLFQLLRPEVRLAYAQSGKEFPLEGENAKFIGAGINVNVAECNQFGQRRSPSDEFELELMFGDFLNYYIVLNLLENIDILSENSNVCNNVGLRRTLANENAFCTSFCSNRVWNGYFSGCKGWQSIKEKIRDRLDFYKTYLAFGDVELNREVSKTKTSPGSPIREVVKILRDSELIDNDTDIFILIDQYEELATIGGNQQKKVDFRSVANRFLNQRDPSVSYRIGTRGYAWRKHIGIFGTDAKLDQGRDFTLLQLDELLARRQDASTSIFPEFARNVFRRRMTYEAAIQKDDSAPCEIGEIFGKSLLPRELADYYAVKNPEAILKLEKEWSTEIKSALRELARTDPLSAKMGEIWLRQKGIDSLDGAEGEPWKKKPYWVKERIEPTLLKIAGARSFKPVFSGSDDILGLSNANILNFLGICRAVWAEAAKVGSKQLGAVSGHSKMPEFPIEFRIQSIGIHQAAREALDKLDSEYGMSKDRYLFVDFVGSMFRTILSNDATLSYPGHNGFSVTIEELNKSPDVADFLIELSDYGNVVMADHTTRYGDKKHRKKFHLNPIYTPVFRIPYQRTKEPKYVTAEIVRDWMAKAGIIIRPAQQPIKTGSQLSPTPLFDRLDD